MTTIELFASPQFKLYLKVLENRLRGQVEEGQEDVYAAERPSLQTHDHIYALRSGIAESMYGIL